MVTIYLYEKTCINIFNGLCQITSEAFTLKASFTVDVTLLGKKKQVAQGLVKGFWGFLTGVQAEIIFHLTYTSRAVMGKELMRALCFLYQRER